MNTLLNAVNLPQVPTRLLIGGEWCEAENNRRFATLDPASEDVLAQVSEAGPSEVDGAVSSARDALRRGPWSRMTGAERGRLLYRLAALMRERSEELVLLESIDAGKPLADPVILHDIKVGMKTIRQCVKMDPDQHMGDLYPFSLAGKLKVITEPSPYYSGRDNPWGKPIVPFEMLSVLFQYRAREDKLPVRGPAVGLFADQEIRLLRGPVFVGESYTTEREVVFLSGSRRTESMWVKTTVFGGDGAVVATMLLNLASIKQSYAPYEKEYAALYS